MFQTDGPLMRAQQPAFQQRDDPMDARQQFRRVALAAQDRDLTSVAFAVERQVANQPSVCTTLPGATSPNTRCRPRALTPFFWLVIHHRAWNHTFRGVRVSWKIVPAVQRSLVRTARTLPERGTQPPRPAFPTTGTAKPFRPAHPEKIITTSFLRSEAPFEVRQRARIVFHGLLHYLLWLPESNGYPLLHEYQNKGFTKIAIRKCMKRKGSRCR